MKTETDLGPTTSLRHAGISDIGRVRSSNDDRFFADPRGQFFIVADGIGSHASGGLAAQIVVELLPRRLVKVIEACRSSTISLLAEQVAGEVKRLSDRILAETRNEPGLAGMGTTVVVAVLRGREGFLVHLGDSRGYLLRDGCLTQLTRDHTLLQKLIEDGQVRPQDADAHPARGRLVRFVGMDGPGRPEITQLDLQTADRLLLCTDGLSGILDADQLLRVLESQQAPHEACKMLVAQANAAGGQDNITAIVAEV